MGKHQQGPGNYPLLAARSSLQVGDLHSVESGHIMLCLIMALI